MTRNRWLMLTLVAVIVLLLVLTPHALLWFVGVYPYPAGTAPLYQLWSGFIPSIAIVSVVWPFVNCHVESCPRYGRYHVGDFRVCRKHHVDEAVREKRVTHQHIIDHHQKHLQVEE